MIILKKYFSVAVIFTIFFTSCKKDIPPKNPQQQGNISVSTSKRLLICNEGIFNSGTASLSVYDPEGNGIINNAYSSANSNQSMGDVLQSYTKFNGKYFWVVNNSGKIIVTDKNFIRLATITGFISPRYIQPVSNNKAYVSNYLSGNNSNQTNYIQILDMNTNTITKTIELDGWSEEMVESYGNVFVTNMKKKYLYVVSTFNDAVVDSVFLNATSYCIVKDANEKIWVSCNADASNNISARLVEFDPKTPHVIEKSISLNTSQNSISRLCITGDESTLYYLLTDVFKMSISSAIAPATPFALQGSRIFYGLCVDPTDETIYISDAIDYNQNGNILRYKYDGSYISTFKAGIIPGFMWIDE